MRILFTITVLFFLYISGLCQKSVSFNIEELPPPKNSLKEESTNEIYKKLLIKDAGYTERKPAPANYNPTTAIVAKSKESRLLVNYGYHSLFDGMYRAYAEHRPFTLSPDMIWLLIMQGFSQHVNNNHEQLRKLFVKHDGKVTLLVHNDKITLDDPNSPWEDVFPKFAEQIEKYTGSQGLKDMTADFSTTTPVTKMASQITLMDAMKKYFEYVVMVIGCGIPSIKLEGSPKDWRNVLEKTRKLEKYELGWWTKELEPILKEFVKASKSKANKDFWRNMFKYHINGIYESKAIDGWFIKFFPYTKDGKRNNLDSLSGSWNLPDEICKVDLAYKFVDQTGNVTTTSLELWAGFVGLQQDKNNFMLRPEIGWMIKRADTVNNAVVKALEANDKIEIRVYEVPKEILALKSIEYLSITFVGNIVIPTEMKNIHIEHLYLRGAITEEESKRITAMFPDTEVIINNRNYRNEQAGSASNPLFGW